jgi:hypothetical protein
MDKSKNPSLLNLVVTASVLITTLVYGFVAINTEDALWFYPTFNEIPEEIFINCFGVTATMRPGDAHYDELTTQINTTLSKTKNYDGTTMSDSTYAYYQTSGVVLVLELFYSQPVRIHSFYRFFSDLDSIVIPLVGRHSQSNAIFGRANGLNTAGSLHYAGMPGVLAFIEANGICTQP